MGSSLFANHVSNRADSQRFVLSPSFLPYSHVDPRQLQCAWTKNPVRKPRTEQHFEAMHKRSENLRARLEDFRKYANYLESLLDNCQQTYHPKSCVEFRAHRPSDTDGLGSSTDNLDFDYDFALMTGDDNDANSDTDPTKEICLPTQSLKVCVVRAISCFLIDGSFSSIDRLKRAA